MAFNFSIYNELINQIKASKDIRRPFILSIDGMCGSGKTTLAEYLSTLFDASIIHMDNFFLPFDRKTEERLAEPGGNIDYERFSNVVIPALKERKPFTYVAYNCQTSAFDREIHIPQCELIIVEGSYSLHQNFGQYYDLSLFLTVSEEEQLQRLKNRCQNDHKFYRFQTEWIPMETLYHNAQLVPNRANLIIDTTSF